jgi:ribosomal protein S12 methylthiotransferase accessory factor
MAPAQLVLFYWNHKLREARIGYATSGGLVFHPDRKRSILYGIYENIERDAINLRWHCRMPPREVKVDLVEFLRDHAALSHPRMSTNSILPIRVLLNTLDIPIPVFSAVTLDRSRTRNMLLAGGGAWSEKERALTQAIFEIGQMQIGYKLFPRAWDNIRPNSQISELVDFYHAPIFYGSVENLPLLNWYVFDGPPVSWDEVPTIAARDVDEEWEIVMPLLRERSINPIVFDFSSACWPGLSVTKVFMPQITFAHIPSHPYFGHPRYYEVPKRVGASDRALNWSDLLTRPLPFP